MMNTQDVARLFDVILQGIETERQAPAIVGLEELRERKNNRARLLGWIAELEVMVGDARQAAYRLPQLPNEERVAYASALMALSNLAFLEIDTTGLNDWDQICRFVVMGCDGQIIEDIFIEPTVPLSASAAEANGLSTEALAEGYAITDIWYRVQNALKGRYILYWSRFDIEVLEREAQRIEQPIYPFIGEDLQALSSRYWESRYPKLGEICERIGQDLPPRPGQSAIDRAQGQLRVLQAMSNAVVEVQLTKSTVVGDDSLAGLDEHPF